MNDHILTEEFTLTLTYRMKINCDTGEVLETKLIKRSVDKNNIEVVDTAKPKKIKDESTTPQLILEDNKYYLNDAAIALMKVTSDDKIDIKYEKQGKQMVPVIGSDSMFGTKGGNKLSKSQTVVCRGSKHDELVKYGSTFEVIPHPSLEGLFILKGDVSKEEVEDEDIVIPEDEELEDLINVDDVTEVDSDMFKFDFSL